MDISKVNQNFSAAVKEVEKKGLLTIERHGEPAYIIMTQEFFNNIRTFVNTTSALNYSINREVTQMEKTYTLHEAMSLILRDQPNKTMRYTELASEIWSRSLYCQKNGKKAPPSQILLRAKNYPALFSISEDKHFITLLH